MNGHICIWEREREREEQNNWEMLKKWEYVISFYGIWKSIGDLNSILFHFVGLFIFTNLNLHQENVRSFLSILVVRHILKEHIGIVPDRRVRCWNSCSKRRYSCDKRTCVHKLMSFSASFHTNVRILYWYILPIGMRWRWIVPVICH